jgi:hypothetical protein
MKNFALASTLLAFASAFVNAQPVPINQATIAASGVNRSTGGFPFTISQPGSYQLTSNLMVPANVNGIVITSSNVTLAPRGGVPSRQSNILT